LLLLVVLSHVLALPPHLLQWIVTRCWLIALVLALPAHLLLLLVVLSRVLALPAPLLLLLVVLSFQSIDVCVRKRINRVLYCALNARYS
jgi:hypothetical protein